jgi:hypothetical protein
MTRHTRRNCGCSRKRRGGAATVFPLSYFDGKPPLASVGPGRDLLHASGLGVRPLIGPVTYGFNGGRRTHNKNSMRRKTKKGGFYPSVMGNFTHAASKYIVPMTLYAGYKMLKKSQQASEKRRTRRTRRR